MDSHVLLNKILRSLPRRPYFLPKIIWFAYKQRQGEGPEKTLFVVTIDGMENASKR